MPTQPKRPRRTKAQLEQARRRREAARRYFLKTRHRMTLEEYDALLEFQGGVCYICRRAKGLKRSLAVDHDHALAREACDHPHDESCRNCWRGLLCSRCNSLLAHARDEVMFFWRALDYLKKSPARRWHGEPVRQMRTNGD